MTAHQSGTRLRAVSPVELLDDADVASQRADELAKNLRSLDDLNEIRLLRAIALDCRERAVAAVGRCG